MPKAKLVMRKEAVLQPPDKPLIAVYKIENILTGKCYVGASRNIKNRWANHRTLLKHGKHPSKQLQEDYDLLGEEHFAYIILEGKLKISQLPIREQFYADGLREKGIELYNQGTDTQAPKRGIKWSAEERRKMEAIYETIKKERRWTKEEKKKKQEEKKNEQKA